MRIEVADFEDAQVRALLAAHLAGMHAASPPCMVHALDLSGLMQPEITLYAAWEGETLVGVGALKALGDGASELKSMRTHASHLRKGVGRRLLEHLLAEARARGYRRVSLETGSGEAFDPALALYRRYGFTNGPRFGEYAESDFNQFLHLDL